MMRLLREVSNEDGFWAMGNTDMIRRMLIVGDDLNVAQKDIAAVLHVSESLVSREVKRLKEKPDEEDRREPGRRASSAPTSTGSGRSSTRRCARITP